MKTPEPLIQIYGKLVTYLYCRKININNVIIVMNPIPQGKTLKNDSNICSEQLYVFPGDHTINYRTIQRHSIRQLTKAHSQIKDITNFITEQDYVITGSGIEFLKALDRSNIKVIANSVMDAEYKLLKALKPGRRYRYKDLSKQNIPRLSDRLTWALLNRYIKVKGGLPIK